MNIVHVNPGNSVLCDWCNKDWTDNPQSGGFLFQNKATCPDCANKLMEKIKKFKEEHFIKGTCPENMSFYEWVLSIR